MTVNIQKGLSLFQLTAARRRLVLQPSITLPVSLFQLTAARRRLAAPPPHCRRLWGFNSQPPEGGWLAQYAAHECEDVSTHSRPKAAGLMSLHPNPVSDVSTHSRPKAAGSNDGRDFEAVIVSTHSRPKAAGISRSSAKWSTYRFNSQPPEGGWAYSSGCLK